MQTNDKSGDSDRQTFSLSEFPRSVGGGAKFTMTGAYHFLYSLRVRCSFIIFILRLVPHKNNYESSLKVGTSVYFFYKR